MLIGLDFDNTVAGYDHVFTAAAEREGLVEPGSTRNKIEVREALRKLDDGEREWMRLQGRVYGVYMEEAEIIDGVGDFLSTCRESGVSVCIVSHKTEFGHFDPDRVNLRKAARNWMKNNRFFDPEGFAIDERSVYFESTRQKKIERIRALDCTHFVDDLEEVFKEPSFPDTTKRYLFAPSTRPIPLGPFKPFTSWRDISNDILGCYH